MRPEWDSYFMKIAYAVSERSTCDRAFVGALLVLDKRILTTGFNGSPAGQPHCDEVGHLRPRPDVLRFRRRLLPAASCDQDQSRQCDHPQRHFIRISISHT